MRPHLGVFLLLVAFLVPYSALSQNLDALTGAYPDSLCGSCASWNAPQEPFRLYHNSYFVGTRGLSAILITDPEGHILLDGGLPNSAPLILENIQTLGFDPGDIALILNSHVHYDHAGGIAAIQRVSGARVAAGPASAPVLERGTSGPDDPQYGVLFDIPAIPDVEVFTPGDTLRVGSLEVVSHATAGHTPGGTTWAWQSCDADRCLNLVYADSQTPVSADDFRYTDSAAYPTALDDFEQGFETLETMPCDILITTHPGASSVWERWAKGPEGLIDPTACQQYAARARQQLEERIRQETAGSQNGE